MPALELEGGRARLAGLDLLRFLAVVLVLGRHMEAAPATWPAPLRMPLDIWRQGGWVGVDLFFVLSGFLVSGLLFSDYRARGVLGIGRFYMRRAWKIYPPFFVLIAVTAVLTLAWGRRIEPGRLLAEVFFVQSYLAGMWNHTWSLAVEEHFYILLPLALTVLLRWGQSTRSPGRPILLAAALVALGALAGRVVNWHLRPSYAHLTHLFPSHLRLDSLFFGVAIAYAYHFHPAGFCRRLTPLRHFLIGCGFALLVPAFAFRLEDTPFVYTYGLTCFYVGSGMLLVGVLLSQVPAGRIVRTLAVLGGYSYSIYLWHMPVGAWGGRLMELGGAGGDHLFVARMAVYLLGSLALGVLMAKLVEVPALRLRNRWFPAGEQRALDVRPPATGVPGGDGARVVTSR